ncbi:MAG: ABC transporter substrate-binding protein [Clostridia bacterium]|nr:ABC transporter substrate-binding protein [Clostridia bacterium]
MRKTLTRIICLVVVAIMALGCLVSCNTPDEAVNYAENNTTIKVGVSGPLTGGAAMYGIAVKNSAQLAIDEINAAGGVNGIMLELVAADDKHEPTQVSTTYTTLYEGGCQLFLGTVTTGPGIQFKDYALEDGIFYLTPSASGDDIPSADGGFQMCFTDSNQGTASATYFNTNYKGKKVGIFYKADDDYSVGIKNNFVKGLDASFGTPVEASFTGDTAMFDSQIATLKDCEIIFMPIYYTPASQFMKQGSGTIKSDAIYFGCDGFDGIDAVAGFDIKSITQEVSYLSHFDSTSTSGPAADYIAAYKAKYPDQPLNQFGAAAYDCVYAMVDALNKSGKEFSATTSAQDYATILKEVFTSDTFVFNGVTGECVGDQKSTITWNDDGTVNKIAVKYVVKEASAN